MTKIAELFCSDTSDLSLKWEEIASSEMCSISGEKCKKSRKSDPTQILGTCSAKYNKSGDVAIICPTRMMKFGSIFMDCVSLMELHRSENEIYLISEHTIHNGCVDFFLISVEDSKVVDFVGIEIQTLDTIGSLWPDLQEFLRKEPMAESIKKSCSRFGINWGMSSKTILTQLSHKVKQFEYYDKKLVLVVQDVFFNNMYSRLEFDHLREPAHCSDAMHIHVYGLDSDAPGGLRLKQKFSTDAEGASKLMQARSANYPSLPEFLQKISTKIHPGALLKGSEQFSKACAL